MVYLYILIQSSNEYRLSLYSTVAHSCHQIAVVWPCFVSADFSTFTQWEKKNLFALLPVANRTSILMASIERDWTEKPRSLVKKSHFVSNRKQKLFTFISAVTDRNVICISAHIFLSVCLDCSQCVLFSIRIPAVSSAEPIYLLRTTQHVSVADFFQIWKSIRNKRQIVSVQLAHRLQTNSTNFTQMGSHISTALLTTKLTWLYFMQEFLGKIFQLHKVYC